MTDGTGTKDGIGSGDHDEPYRFGRAPLASTACPSPFTMPQLLSLLKLRGKIQDQRIARHIQPPDQDGLE